MDALEQGEESLCQYPEQLVELVDERTADPKKMVNTRTDREVRMTELKGVIRKLRAQLKEAGLEPVANDPLLEQGP
jgi:hypothetical protein